MQTFVDNNASVAYLETNESSPGYDAINRYGDEI